MISRTMIKEETNEGLLLIALHSSIAVDAKEMSKNQAQPPQVD